MVKKFVWICLGTIFSLSLICSIIIIPKETAFEKSRTVVVIDAGHGGIDAGVTGISTGVKESDVNLALARILKERFEGEGFDVVMTRNSEAGLYGNLSKGFKARDLKKRMEIADAAGADVFISIHMNEYKDEKRRGAQVFYRAKDGKSRELARIIQEELNQMEEATREVSALSGDYYVLNYSTCPSVIVECGFLSNREEEALLITDEYKEKLAHAIYLGVIKALLQESEVGAINPAT